MDPSSSPELAAGLLSRIVTTPRTQRFLIVETQYRMVCRRIAAGSPSPAVATTGAGATAKNSSTIYSSAGKAATTAATATAVPAMEKWQTDERGHYVRILASITLSTEQLISIGMQEKVVPALLSLLAQPRTDAGTVTPQSVILMPFTAVSALITGNIARCLMPYAEQPAGIAALYGDKKLMGIEKLICSMASCTDMRVRKNIAILLAKGCRDAEVRERVTALRGMQMIVELQHKF